jgi:hypothetical protein
MSEARPATTRRTSTGLTLTVGLVTGMLGIAGNVVAAFVTQWSGSISWFAVPCVAVAVAVVTAFATTHVEDRFDADRSSHNRARRGRSVPSTLVAVVLVLGLGGIIATAGIRYVTGYVTGDEPGTDRLVQPVTNEVSGLSLTVTKFEETRHFTRLTVTVTNGVGNSLSLPLFGNSLVVGGDGTALEADSFRSDWSETVASGVRQSGTITFSGHLPAGVRRARLVFSTVFEQGFDGPDSIQVTDLRLRPRT